MSKKAPPCIKIHRSKNKEFYCTVHAEGNRAVLHTSETVKRRRTVLNNIRALANVFRGKIPLIEDLA